MIIDNLIKLNPALLYHFNITLVRLTSRLQFEIVTSSRQKTTFTYE